MKKALLIVLFVLLAIACKKEATLAVTGSEQPVGINNDGKFELTEIETLKEQWQLALGESGFHGRLENFSILKGTTQGDAREDYYILIARTGKGEVKTAAMLYLEDNNFYLEKQQGPETLVYVKIACKGLCGEGCDPVVQVNNGSRFLVCSPCIDCVKSEKEMR
jgi:hypothetical protein